MILDVALEVTINSLMISWFTACFIGFLLEPKFNLKKRKRFNTKPMSMVNISSKPRNKKVKGELTTRYFHVLSLVVQFMHFS